MTADKVGELEALLARLDERTDGDYLARLSNGVCIASECADFLRENGRELLRVYRAWQGAAVVGVAEEEIVDVDSRRIETWGLVKGYVDASLIGTRVRLVPDGDAA